MNFELVANTVRGLAIDGVQKANSGHPGLPMGAADYASVLFLKHLRHCPNDPAWPDRDRFILSAGHGSMLLYSMLHLTGYDLPLEELARFRQWGSLTPGHPEHGLTAGVETSTGPLGQGASNGVGMALAEAMLAARFNRDGHKPVNHYTYALCSDGDMMEGISHEAFSLAGHLKLNKLVIFYDFNRITIEGSTDLAYSDDVRKRFEGYNWHVIEVDGHDYEALDQALISARMEQERPTLIIGCTTIGKGSPNLAGTPESHGAPLGPDEVKATKRNLGLPEHQDFYVSDEVRAIFEARRQEWQKVRDDWEADFKAYCAACPEQAKAWQAGYNLEMPVDLYKFLPDFDPEKPVATRKASEAVIQKLAQAVPYLVGGSADLAPSTCTLIKGAGDIAPHQYAGRNFHFGVREHAMGAIMNGIALHGGLRVYGATFFVFADYCRPAVRLAAIMKLPVIYVFTHDSFYVGEDGPTHEPVEQTASLRIIPGMTVIRPADPTETGAAWVTALKNTAGPTALLLTRQNLAVIDRTKYPKAAMLEQGAYVLWQSGKGKPQLIMIASGSEVELALKAAETLAADGVNVRVVSMPSWELFERQPEKLRRKVLPPSCKLRLALEAGVSLGWERYIGPKGRMLGLERFGLSAPYKVLAEKLGFTPDNVVKIAREMLQG
ncbi:MAG: transketolase [Kiritimatiellia bacterium]|nr:transketolase [Lentisphaerota bacterium]